MMAIRTTFQTKSRNNHTRLGLHDMRHDGNFVNARVAKQLQSGSLDVIQRAAAKIPNVMDVGVESLADSARFAPAETEFLTGVKVGPGHKDIVAFCEVGTIIFGRGCSRQFPVLGQGGLYARM